MTYKWGPLISKVPHILPLIDTLTLCYDPLHRKFYKRYLCKSPDNRPLKPMPKNIYIMT